MAKYISKLINGEELYYIKDTEARANLIDKTEKGAASGVATLDQNGKIPDSQLPDGIGVQVQADWNLSDSTAVDYIKNKPVSMPASDVSTWAKLSTKPSYTKGEVGLSNVTNDAQVKRSEMGTASGVATLDSAGKVPSSQLPSYVDDVLEYDTKSAFPTTGEAGKIYVDKSTNTTWRWSGSAYVQIKGDLVIGTTTGTAADGGVASSHYGNTSNPHSVTKAQVGLGSVVNTGDSATPVSGGTTKFTTGGAYTELAKKVDKVDGKGLSTNDYTTDEKNKLAGIAAGAEVNVQSDWNATSGDAAILNKPTIPTVNNGKFSIKGDGTEVASTTANASSASSVDIVAGSNVTVTPDATNRKITIAANDTTYGVVSTSANGLAPKVTDTSKFLKGDGTWATPTDTNNRRSFYGTCDTAADTAAKAVTISDTAGWELKAGTIVGIKFTNTNSASNVTLNVNSSGAKSIWYNNAAYTGNSSSICGYASRVTYYMYDGTYWVWLNMGILDGNTDKKVTQTVTTTSADYEVLFSATADNTTRTEEARKNSNLKFNPSTGNLQATQLNGVTIGSSPKFTDTTYSSKSAASEGTDVSLVTTGEKYIWNNKTSNTGTVTSVAVKMNGATKGTVTTSGTIDLGTVLTSHQDISGKVDKTTTVNGHALSGNVSVTKSDVGLGNVGNFKAVSTVASQGLSDTEKSNARANIGAGTSSFSGSYNDLSNKPTIPTVNDGTLTIKQNGTSKGTFTANQSGGSTIELTDTTYSSKNASSGGTDVSLVTTGEKYAWNNKGKADEEDITLSNGVLKFKDRPNTDGMGMIILRKNMVDGVNTLTQGMLNQTNTTYVIQYDYYLVSDINIPESCTLRFEGGCIHNSQVSGTYNNYKLISSGDDGVYIIEDGHMILDYVHITGKIKNDYINASSLGVSVTNTVDNAARLNRFWNSYCGVRLDEYGNVAGNEPDSSQKYYLIERPIYISNDNGKLIGSGGASNACTVLVPTADFYTNYPDRGVIETYNYWAGLDGRSASYCYVYGINVQNIQVRCFKRADYGLVVWACGEDNNVERMYIAGARKANFFFGGYSAVARLQFCTAMNSGDDAYNFLFDNHPRTDYAPNVSAENGGRGFGGSASLVECSGDATNWLKTGNGGFALDIVAPKVENVNRVITSDNNSTGNTAQQIRITGGRIQFNSSAGDKTILYAKSETKCFCTIENMTAYNHRYMAYYTDTSSGINNIGSADTINHWSNGNLEARGSQGIRSKYFRPFSWSDQQFGILSDGITNTLAATGNQTGWIVQSDYSAALIYRNMLMMQAGQGSVFRIFSMNGGKDAQTIVMDTSKLSGTTANRPTSVTMFGKTYDIAKGYCYFDTTLGKPIWYKGSSKWVDATGNEV